MMILLEKQCRPHSHTNPLVSQTNTQLQHIYNTVAILAKRGQCTYETKARVASTLTSPHGTVRFVIVYDNLPSDGNHLITMTAKDDGGGDGEDGGRKKGHELWKDMGLVFVSYESGVGKFIMK